MTAKPGRKRRRPATADRDKDPAELAVRLGHAFADQGLLIEALTHQSAAELGRRGATDYDRLEFLGDRVLGLVVAEMLYREFAADAVGDLARRHVELVRAETLASVAAEIGLDEFIRMSAGEARAGARASASIRTDVMEALLAALYLDGGLDVARAFIRRHWGPLMRAHAEPPTDPKTALQEWLQARGQGLPRYDVTGQEGPDHAPVFTVAVTVGGHQPLTAEGPSKRAAETAAAAAMLERLTRSE